MGASDHSYFFYVIKGEELIYSYPRDPSSEKIFTVFINLITAITESISKESKNTVVRSGDRIFLTRIEYPCIYVLAAPSEAEEDKLIGIFNRIFSDISKMIRCGEEVAYLTIGLLRERIDSFMENTIATKLPVLAEKKPSLSRIFIKTEKGKSFILGGKAKSTKEKTCYNVLDAVNPESFLGEVIEKIDMDLEQFNDCIKFLVEKDLITPTPTWYSHILLSIKLLNNIIKNSATLIGSSLVRNNLDKILKELDITRFKLYFDKRRLEVRYGIASKLRDNPSFLKSVNVDEVSEAIDVLRELSKRILDKFGEIMGENLKSSFFESVKKDFEKKYGIGVF